MRNLKQKFKIHSREQVYKEYDQKEIFNMLAMISISGKAYRKYEAKY